MTPIRSRGSSARKARRLRTLDALCRRIASDAYADTADENLADAVDVRIAALPPLLRDRLRLVLTLFDSRVAAVATRGLPRRFSSLPPEAQDRWLRRWESSRAAPLRAAFQAVRRLVLSTWYSQPAAQAVAGYRGTPHLRLPEVPWEGPLYGVPDDTEPVLRTADPAAAWLARGRTPPAPAPALAPANARASAGATGEKGGIVRTDVCVIGSGAGGAVAAARLAEAGYEVVVLEEGGHWTTADFTEDERELVPKLYADAGARCTEDGSLTILQGRGVGGGSTVNWMIMLRTADAVLEEWAREHGTDGMGPADLAPVFARIEEEVHARLVPDEAHAPSNRIILEGAGRLGWSARAARINADGCVRAGTCGLGCRYGAKRSVLATFIPRSVAAGARIVAGAAVERIEQVERGGAAPVKRVHAALADPVSGTPRGALIVEAPIVVLAAGAVGTPAILQRSGLGGGGVGKYLRVHPTSAVVARFDRETYPFAGIPQSSLCDEFLHGEDGYGFWIESPALSPGLAAAAIPGFGAAHRDVVRELPHLGCLIVLVRDGAERRRSSGDVRIDRVGRARIRYGLAPRDRRTLARGIESTARLLFAAGARRAMTLHAPARWLSGPDECDGIADRSLDPNRFSLLTAHVNGTCRIGTDPRTSGCTPDGERHGTRGLYVVDGSILPTAPGVNPQETIMALSSILSERIAARHRPA